MLASVSDHWGHPQAQREGFARVRRTDCEPESVGCMVGTGANGGASDAHTPQRRRASLSPGVEAVFEGPIDPSRKMTSSDVMTSSGRQHERQEGSGATPSAPLRR